VISLVLGGTRSGKSAVAERIAGASGAPVTYVATGIVTDPEMAGRIAAHQARRPATWTTVEAGPALVSVLAEHPDGVVLVDSLGAWVASHEGGPVDVAGLIAALQARRGNTVVVAEEVGLAVHPPTEAGRRFVDELGRVNQAVAVVAARALLVVAGRVLPLPAVQDGARFRRIAGDSPGEGPGPWGS
jgi:adenosyl cobinamide kinase/adenosyl cobinamide phosphate guanylyltransferase